MGVMRSRGSSQKSVGFLESTRSAILEVGKTMAGRSGAVRMNAEMIKVKETVEVSRTP